MTTRNMYGPGRLIALLLLATAACSGPSNDGNTQQAADNATDTSALAGGAQGCERFLVAGKAPTFANPALAQKTQLLCNRAYLADYSGVTRTPMWSADRVTQAGLDARRGIKRVDDFRADDRVNDGPTLTDYRGSGYDRGHLSPDADMPTRESENQSFLLSNIAPQTANLNRHSWAQLEGALRRQARGGPVYIVTGVLFQGQLNSTHDDGRVKIPSSFWKAAYAKDRGATVFVASNEDRPRWQNMNVDQFTKVFGIDPFPGLDPRYRTSNGATDGSMNVGPGMAGKGGNNGSGGAGGGANGGGGNGGTSAGAHARKPSDAVRDENGMYMLRQDYINTHHHDYEGPDNP